LDSFNCVIPNHDKKILLHHQLPSEQPWLTYYADGIIAPQVVTDGVRLQTTFGNHADFSNYYMIMQSLKNFNFPSLDKDKGVVLQFELQVYSENHNTTDRAGFSVILFDSNCQGVEIRWSPC
jgi:hypothetical protein